MNVKTILFLGGLAGVIAAGSGIVKVKHGLAIGAALVALAFLMPESAPADGSAAV